jgi:ATP-binding protein involved in chromosome partitioning
MAASVEQVIEALTPVEDPELHRSIVELDMVRNVKINGGEVIVTVALTVAGCPLRTEITRRITEALTPLNGIEQVGVEMTVMTPEELDNVRRKMGSNQSGSTPQPAHSHKRTLPFGAGSGTRVIGVTSGKGGVGKSSVTVNLAATFARRGYEVAVLDADVYGFSVPKMLGIVDEPNVVHEMLIPPIANGVRCISIGFFVDDDKPIMWRGPMLHKALEQFLTDVEWGNPDYLFVDMPPGTGDVAMSMAQYLPTAEIIVVTTPQPAAQRVAQRSGMMAREINLPLAGVVENMSWFTGNDGERYELFGSGGGQALAEKLSVPLLGQIPLAVQLREGGDEGNPVVVSNPESEVAFGFEQLAQQLEKTAPRRVYREELRVR